MAIPPGSMDDKILEAVREFPGISQKEISTLLNINPSSLKDIMPRLTRSNKIYPKKGKPNSKTGGGRPCHCYYISDNLGPEKPTKKSKPQKATDLLENIKLEQDNSALLKELEELRIWKQRALLCFPELDVGPIIYQAREMLAKHYPDQKQKDDILSGKSDKRPPMLAMIEVLENQQ